MTFSKIAFKMLKAEINKYRLFILCNLISIAILYSFISIAVNKQFMDRTIVDPMISSNIYAPTFFVLLFMGIFIPYSQSVFIKTRQKDYGILLTIGMTDNEVRNNVLLENLVLCIVSLIIGLILGTILSVFFLGYIHIIMGISNINITISILPYGLTAAYVLGIFAVSLIINLVGIIRSTILEKLKYAEKAESGKHYNIIFILWGIVFTIAALIVMNSFYNRNDLFWFLSLLFSILGSALVFFNGEALIEYFQKRHYKRYIKNIFLFSDIKYYYGKSKKIFLATTWIFFVILFFTSLCFASYHGLKNNVITYHPFHMAYGEVKGHFEGLEVGEIEKIAENNGNSITSNDKVKFMRNNTFTIFCVDDINKIFKKNYEVKSNSLIYVYPYDMNDGYKHNVNLNISSISIDAKEGNKKFDIQDEIIEPLFGQTNCISSNILLVNKEDYEWISSNSSDYRIQGILNLYNFKDWRNSNEIVKEVSNKLLDKNNIKTVDRFYKISSRIEAYNTALKSCDFLIFNIVYMCILLYFAAIIMFHFKFKMEYKDEKRKYFSLYRIGIRDIEIKKIISKKLLIIYSISPIYAIIMNVMYSYYINNSYGNGKMGSEYAFIISFVFLAIHLIVYRIYFIKYHKRVILELSIN